MVIPEADGLLAVNAVSLIVVCRKWEQRAAPLHW